MTMEIKRNDKYERYKYEKYKNGKYVYKYVVFE
jgi:hypothetical protein